MSTTGPSITVNIPLWHVKNVLKCMSTSQSTCNNSKMSAPPGYWFPPLTGVDTASALPRAEIATSSSPHTCRGRGRGLRGRRPGVGGMGRARGRLPARKIRPQRRRGLLGRRAFGASPHMAAQQRLRRRPAP